jgi:hypothetical protein
MEAIKNNLRQYYNSIREFDPDEPILVIYDELTNTCIYHQNSPRTSSRSYFASSIVTLYLPEKFRYGVLTPPSLAELKASLNGMFESGYFDDPSAVTRIGRMACEFYKTNKNLGKFNPGPQLAFSLKFVTFTNPIVVRFVLWKFSMSSRMLLKRIKYDKQHKDDSIKENMAALAPELFAVKDLNRR